MTEKIKILHLEDSLRDADMIRDLLNADGLACEITSARDKAAFETALARGAFDLVICDYNLPDIDGLTALKLAEASYPDAPIIIVSGAIDSDEAVACLKAGATDYLLKQRLDRLPSAIRHAMQAARDRQERRAALEQLRESQQGLAQAQATAHVGSWEWDILTGAERWSDEQYRIFGYRPQEVPATYEVFRRAVHPDDWEAVQRAIDDDLKNRKPYALDFRIVRPDGAIHWIHARAETRRDAQGVPVLMSGIVQDITERKRADAAVAESERFMRASLDALSAHIAVLDTDGTIVAVNENWRTFARANHSDPQRLGEGANYLDVCDRATGADADSSRTCAAAIRDVIAGRTSESALEYPCHSPTMQRWFRCRTTRFSGTGSARVVVAHENITAQRVAEIALLREQRIESVGRLASGIAHDLNNMLTPILVSVEMLREEFPGTASEILGSVDACARRAAAMVKHLLAFSKGTVGERTHLQVGDLVSEVMKLIAPTFPKNITIELHDSGAVQPVLGDSTQLHQVLLNLLVNARDAMPSGGRITIELETVTVDGSNVAMMPEAKPGRYVSISIADTGTGITPENIERIFEPFFSTKDLDGGTGLGLANVLGIVRGHGGFLRVESRVGLGSDFRVFLPAAVGHAAQPAPCAAAPHIRGRGRAALVVDDEEGIRSMFKCVLSKMDFRVLTATDGTDAVACFTKHPGIIHLVITDLSMPKMDGVSLARIIKRLDPETRIIAMSGLQDARRADELDKLGITIQIQKPCSQEELTAALCRALDA